ncbi:Disease resistance protein RGA2 [Bienertia sinuspersici]
MGYYFLGTLEMDFERHWLIQGFYPFSMLTNICKPSIILLQGLNESDSWSLFMERLCDHNLTASEKEKTVTEILSYCASVPLAIRAIRDLLRDQNEENGILPSLKLSYDYLPHTTLKKCFSYCAIFGEDEVIEENKLICMWMAHDFLQPYDEMELIEEQYFKILFDHSLFQEGEMDEIGNVKSFKKHDLVWSLARAVSMGESFCSCRELFGRSSDIRHLSLPYLNSKLNFTCTKLQQFSFGTGVLRIRGYCNENSLSEVLDGSFKNLRYLEIGVLEEGKGRLLSNIKSYHLQTLCIKHLSPSVTSKISGSVSLIIKGIGDLVKLRHIHCQDLFDIPKGLGRLTAGGRISELGLLNNLRGTLEINNLQCLTSKEEDALSIFSSEKLKGIKRLILS